MDYINELNNINSSAELAEARRLAFSLIDTLQPYYGTSLFLDNREELDNLCPMSGIVRGEIDLTDDELSAQIRWRTDNLLSMLRKDGFCTETSFLKLASRANALNMRLFSYSKMKTFPASGEKAFTRATCKVLKTEKVWVCAIEQVLLLNRPEVFQNPSLDYVRAAKEYIDDIYVLAFFYALVFTYMDMLSGMDKLKAEVKELRTYADRVGEERKKLEYEFTRYRKECSPEGDSAAEKRVKLLEKDNARLYHECLEYKKLLDKAEAASSASETEPAVEDDKEDIPVPVDVVIPSKRVVFLGGHPNLIKKLRTIHPDWIYISTEDLKKADSVISESALVDFIVYYSAHVSHVIDTKIRKELADKPLIYVTATNIDRLEQEIRDGFSQYFASSQS